jgi:hypothetical protein
MQRDERLRAGRPPLTVVPVVLGAGKPLFERPLPGPPMRLTASLPRPTGMVELRFEVRDRR